MSTPLQKQLHACLLALPMLFACGDSPPASTADGGPTPTADGGVGDAGVDARNVVCGDGVCEEGEVCTADCGCACDTDFECTEGCACDPECGVCQTASCQSNVAATCDGELTLFCGDFGASCSGYEDADGRAFQWCDCGELADGEGRCLGTSDAVLCEGGFPQLANCPLGTVCAEETGSIGCACDNFSDDVCPDDACTEDPDCVSCTPSCAGAACGPNGCGGSCGECAVGTRCEDGSCVASCTPNCEGRACGSDGCGGTCGSCTDDATCNDEGQCVEECRPSCPASNTCGPDGCGGRCGGACSGGEFCQRGDSPDDWTCGCDDRFSRIEYTVDASELAFAGDGMSRLIVATVVIQHIDEDGTEGRPRSFAFDPSSMSLTNTFADTGCSPRVRVQRRYDIDIVSPTFCRFDEVIEGSTRIEIPPVELDEEGRCVER